MSNKLKIEVYTSIVGDKDTPRQDIKVFTDYDKFKLPVMSAKLYKILPHKFLDCDVSIWLDGNIFLNISKEQIVKEFLGDADIAIHRHPDRDDVYDECDIAIKYKGDDDGSIKKHKEYLQSINYPKHDGLYNGGVIIRRHTPEIEAFNNAWWSEICCHSSRDQISLPVVLKKFPNLKINILEGSPSAHPRRKHHPYYNYINHKI